MKTEDISSIIKEYTYLKRRRYNVILHNVLQDFKEVFIFAIGIVMAIIFWLAYKGSILLVTDLIKESPYLEGVIFVILVFIYACVFHDLIIPYLKKDYIKVPKIVLK